MKTDLVHSARLADYLDACASVVDIEDTLAQAYQKCRDTEPENRWLAVPSKKHYDAIKEHAAIMSNHKNADNAAFSCYQLLDSNDLRVLSLLDISNSSGEQLRELAAMWRGQGGV